MDDQIYSLFVSNRGYFPGDTDQDPDRLALSVSDSLKDPH